MTSEKNFDKAERETNGIKRSQNLLDQFVVPELLCQCLQKCTERVGAPLIQKVSMYYFAMKEDKERQKQYLASLILGKEKKNDKTSMEQGKRLRKMSYRYFVPVLTDTNIDEITSLVLKCEKSYGEFLQLIPKIFRDKNRNHIEVCLKAFTTIHTISEKKVIITRTVFQLRDSLKCSKPFSWHMLSKRSNDTVTMKTALLPTYNKKSSKTENDLTTAVAKWLSENQFNHSNYFYVNPRAYLPEGLILPDSIDCMPIFANGVTLDYENSIENGLDIVENFFHNQLWKLEYLSNSDNVGQLE